MGAAPNATPCAGDADPLESPTTQGFDEFLSDVEPCEPCAVVADDECLLRDLKVAPQFEDISDAD